MAELIEGLAFSLYEGYPLNAALQKAEERLKEVMEKEREAAEAAAAAAAAACHYRALHAEMTKSMEEAEAAEADLQAAQHDVDRINQEHERELESLKQDQVGDGVTGDFGMLVLAQGGQMWKKVTQGVSKTSPCD